MFTEQDATDMREAIRALELKEQLQAKAANDIKIQEAEDWFITIAPKEPTTRNEALDNFKTIQNLLKTETDPFRLELLIQELEIANENYKEQKLAEVTAIQPVKTKPWWKFW